MKNLFLGICVIAVVGSMASLAIAITKVSEQSISYKTDHKEVVYGHRIGPGGQLMLITKP